MIIVKYFGLIAEKTNCFEEIYSIDSIDFEEFINEIKNKHQLQNQVFSVAVNERIMAFDKNMKLKINDIIAILPPFAGG